MFFPPDRSVVKLLAFMCLFSSVIESKKISNTRLDLISEALKANSSLTNMSRPKRQSSKPQTFLERNYTRFFHLSPHQTAASPIPATEVNATTCSRQACPTPAITAFAMWASRALSVRSKSTSACQTHARTTPSAWTWSAPFSARVQQALPVFFATSWRRLAARRMSAAMANVSRPRIRLTSMRASVGMARSSLSPALQVSFSEHSVELTNENMFGKFYFF